MSRLTNYFAAKELVKLQLGAATRCAGVGKTDRAMTHLIEAVRELLIAQNNLVSLAFEKRRDLRRKKVPA